MNISIARRRLAPIAAIGATALVLAACGSDPETAGTNDGESGSGESASDLSGTLNGSGASSQEAAMQAWIAGFQGVNPDVTVNYSAEGSGTGREQFISGAVPFAGTDAALDEEEVAAATDRCGGEPAIHLPNFVDPIAVMYNLEGVDNLQLSPATIAGIFSGTITTWEDPAIAADNPDATIPAGPITVAHRSGDSGTTENFTEYLAAVVPDAWTYEVSGEWPAEITAESAGTSSELVSLAQQTPGSITYSSLSTVGDNPTAKVKVGEEYVEPTAEAAAAVVDASPQVEGAGEHDHAIEVARDTTESGAYPIVLVSYHLACLSYDDAAEGELTKAFLSYIISEDGQAAAADAAGSAPISADSRSAAEAALEAITVG